MTSRVLILSLHTELTGGPRVAGNLRKHLPNSTHYTLLIPNHGEPPDGTLGLQAGGNFRILASGLLRLHRLLNDLQPAVVITESVHASFLAALLRPIHRYSLTTRIGRLKDQRRALNTLQKLSFFLSDKIVAPTKSCAESFRPPPKKTSIIPNPLDFHDLDRHKLASAGANTPSPFYLYLGRLIPEKNVEAAISFFARERALGYTGFLRIVGDGPESYRRTLEDLAERSGIADYIVWSPPSDSPYALLSMANAVLFFSKNEGFGYVPLESLYLGTPVITSRTRSGHLDVLTEYGSGYVILDVAPGEQTLFSSSICRCAPN
ncbi:hypothetical protein CKO15_11290 [Halorhodospira abdelmalekii]|uniref:glycosyltransferase n=1 Tax=Halorhodospira abdelmalekii TaxID=421629 RepID=UPI003B8468F6|nr:hypothetical protein [Halorhodospira abdelmalekii]